MFVETTKASPVKTTCFQLKALQLRGIKSLEIYLQDKLTYQVT